LNGRRINESNVLPGERLTVGLTKITVQYHRACRPAGDSQLPASRTKLPSSFDPPRPPNADPDTMELHR
jgi:hypothetical protein